MVDGDITGHIKRIGNSSWYKVEGEYNPTIYFDIKNVQGFLFSEKGVEDTETGLIEKNMTVIFNNGVEETVILIMSDRDGTAFQYSDKTYYKTVEDLEKILDTPVKE